MISGGYVLQPRSFDGSEASKMPPCTREVWFFILRNANHKDSKQVKRGQCFLSIKNIQDALHWHVGYRKMEYTKTQVAKSLRRLREDSMIDTTKTTRGMIITVCNYDVYQDPGNYEGHNEGTMKATRRKSSGDTINKNVKEQRIKNKDNYSDDFVLFWGAYPKKIGKGAAYKAWVKIDTSNGMVEKIISAVNIHKKSHDWQKDNGQFIPHPTTWLNQSRWEDEIEVIDKSDPAKYDNY